SRQSKRSPPASRQFRSQLARRNLPTRSCAPMCPGSRPVLAWPASPPQRSLPRSGREKIDSEPLAAHSQRGSRKWSWVPRSRRALRSTDEASMRTPTADEMIRALELEPHPEGGHYRETFRDLRQVDGGPVLAGARRALALAPHRRRG